MSVQKKARISGSGDFSGKERNSSSSAGNNRPDHNDKNTWRTAPDDFSFQRNQKFHISDAASTPSSAKNVSHAPLLKPIFASEDSLPVAHITKPNALNQLPLTPSSSSSSSTSSKFKPSIAPPVPIVSSRNMKASAPISRAAVQVIHADERLKRLDEEAKALREANQRGKKRSHADAMSSETPDSASASSAAPATTAASAPVPTPSARALFKAYSSEVSALGATALDAHNRKVYVAQLEAQQGFLPAKPIYTPFKIHKGIEAKREMKQKSLREFQRSIGLKVVKEGTLTSAKKMAKLQEERERESASGGYEMKIGRGGKGGSSSRGALSFHTREIQMVVGRGGRGGGRGGSRGRR